MFQKTYVYKTPLLCNAKCSFCLSRAKQIKSLYVYPRKSILKDFLYIKKMWFQTIILVWWESTIIKNFEDFILISKKLSLEIIITTNWFVFSNFEYLEYLKKLWLKNIIFSFHSHIPELHDELVWISWAFEKITQAMKNAKKLNFDHISTSTVITSKNQNFLDDIISFIRIHFKIYINNFCALDIHYKHDGDYKKKSFLFPDLKIIQEQILSIHHNFFNMEWSILLQNLPLCAFTEETFYLNREYWWKLKYYESSFDTSKLLDNRVKDIKCLSCSQEKQCLWFFPYSSLHNITPFK